MTSVAARTWFLIDSLVSLWCVLASVPPNSSLASVQVTKCCTKVLEARPNWYAWTAVYVGSRSSS